ncbi:hypothetical protein ACTFIR_009382 [Dictyostelium discoideum]
MERQKGLKKQLLHWLLGIVLTDNTCGRNNNGHITCRYSGGGHKLDIQANVASIEYDPNRSAFIALLNYRDGKKRYIIAPEGLNAGDTVIASDENPLFTTGCSTQLRWAISLACFVDFGDFGMHSKSKHVELLLVWILIFPDKPMAKKPLETRMGKGKGGLDLWAAPIKPGRILFEVGNVPRELAQDDMRRTAARL